MSISICPPYRNGSCFLYVLAIAALLDAPCAVQAQEFKGQAAIGSVAQPLLPRAIHSELPYLTVEQNRSQWLIVIPAVLGSTAGAYAGAVAIGHGLDAARAEYSEVMLGVIAGAAIGGALGSAALAYLSLPEESDATFLRALLGGTIGILPGLGMAALTPGAAFAGFGLGQGVTTAVVLNW